MQVNRKYYLMILLVTIILSLALQGDSVQTNLNEISPNIALETKNEAYSSSIANIQMNEYNSEKPKSEDTFIAEGKYWIINKETILGY